MHRCPCCGQACYCHGDIDDCECGEIPECLCPITAPPKGCGEDLQDYEPYEDGPEGYDDNEGAKP